MGHPLLDPEARRTREYLRWRRFGQTATVTTYTTWGGFALFLIYGILVPVLGGSPMLWPLTLILGVVFVVSFPIWIWTWAEHEKLGQDGYFQLGGRRMEWDAWRGRDRVVDLERDQRSQPGSGV